MKYQAKVQLIKTFSKDIYADSEDDALVFFYGFVDQVKADGKDVEEFFEDSHIILHISQVEDFNDEDL